MSTDQHQSYQKLPSYNCLLTTLKSDCCCWTIIRGLLGVLRCCGVLGVVSRLVRAEVDPTPPDPGDLKCHWPASPWTPGTTLPPWAQPSTQRSFQPSRFLIHLSLCCPVLGPSTPHHQAQQWSGCSSSGVKQKLSLPVLIRTLSYNSMGNNN